MAVKFQSGRPLASSVAERIRAACAVQQTVRSSASEDDNAKAPDVEVTISLNGQHVAEGPKVANNFFPTWAESYSDPITIGDYDQIEIHATDIDLINDDEIGVCTIRGMPYVNEQGYAADKGFTCLGQLWAVALQVAPAPIAQK